MNPLAIIGLIPQILRIVDLVKGAVGSGLSFRSITDLIQNADILDLFKNLGAQLFPHVKPEFQATAAVTASYSTEYVKKVQNAANQLLKPSPALDVDGHYGPLTQKAVMALQKQLGVEVVDGWVGDNTMAAINVAVAKLSEPPPPPVVEIPKV